jgi:hypothetical protein
VVVSVLRILAGWSMRRWTVAVGAGGASLVLLGVPTAVVPNPVFGRSVPPTAWALPVLLVTSVLAGMLAATYVNDAVGTAGADESLADHSVRTGGTGGLLAFFAIGCPVCNKVVLLALGTTGAMNVFAPIQPLLAAAGLALLAWALRIRLLSADACAISSDR